ncbi:MAG: dehydratase [Leptothrix sp. (in: Bacteria)]|nr:dehydratase [Leptothrix sp. (in: b-proteobacteria)]
MLVVPDPSALSEHLRTEVGVSDWVRVDQARIDRFAEITEDWQWIHTDKARAQAESPFRDTVAHGFLTLSLLSRFVNSVVRVDGARLIVAAGLGTVRFVAPVVAGSQVRGRVRLRELAQDSGFVQALWRVSVEIDGVRHPCMVADWTVRYYT